MYDNVHACQLFDAGNEAPFTAYSSVNQNSDLNALNLNWREQDLPQRERTKHVHSLHPYMGKFIPQLVEIFLRKFEPQLVYDPFSGSGTTLVEAKSLGIPSIGTDISLFNVLLSDVKAGDYNLKDLNREVEYVLDALKYQIGDFTGHTDNEYLHDWFSERSLSELLAYRNIIEGLQHSDVFKVALSRSARSARLTTHFDLDFPKKPQRTPYECYKHSRICRPVDEAYKFLRRYTIDTAKRIAEFHKLAPTGKVEIIHGDSRTVDLPVGIDMVFTSPPYIGMIDYHEQHRYAYELLGLENNEDKEIGPAKRGSSVKAKSEYIEGINEVLLHTRSFMAEKGIMAIVVNDKHDLYNPDEVGFRQIGRVERHVNRRTGRRANAFYESILIWENKV